MKLFIFIAIAITLLFFPIPIKITLKYANKNLELYLYNVKINSSIKHKTKIKAQKQKNKKRKKKSKSFDYSLSDISNFISSINSNKLKPHLRFKLYLNYGLDDAANTAISYGYLNCFNVILYKMLQVLFKVTKIELNIIPNFDNPQVQLENTSIILINLVNILSIVFIFIFFSIHVKKNKIKNNKHNLNTEI